MAREMASPFMTRRMRLSDGLDSGIRTFLQRREGCVMNRSRKRDAGQTEYHNNGHPLLHDEIFFSYSHGALNTPQV